MAANWLARVKAGLLGVGAVALVVFISQPDPPKQLHKERIPVEFWHMWTAEWKDVVDKIVAEYNASQDKYEVIALSVPSGGADTKFLLAVAGGNPPDVMAQWNPVIPTWADCNLLVPLDELMTPEERERFQKEAYPVVQKVGSYKDRLYGITIGINIFACYYNPQQLRDKGFDPDKFPTTLEELDAMGADLHVYDAKKNLIRMGFSPPDIVAISPLFGGGFYDWDQKKVVINTPENLKALKYIVGHRRKLGFDNVVRFEAQLNTGSFAAGWPFIGGAYSVTFDGQWRVEQLGKFAPQMEYRTAEMPAPKDGVQHAGYSNGNFMIIPRGAKSVDGAWDFIKFWSGIKDPERAAKFYTMGGWLPLDPRVANAKAYQAYLTKYPQFRTFLRVLESPKVQPAPPVPYQMFLQDRIFKYQDLAYRGTLSPEAALIQLEKDVNHEVARRKELGYGE